MMFRCAPMAPDRGAHAGSVTNRSGRQLTVDIHCHFFSKRAAAFAQPHFSIGKEPTLAFATAETREINRIQSATVAEQANDLNIRLDAMDRQGIDIQAISPAPTQYYYWMDPELGREAARLVNDDVAAACAKHPDRFVPMGTIPLQDVRLAVEELDRCVDDLGFRAIEISSHVNEEELSSDRLAPFFARAEERSLLLFLHPLGFTQGQRLSRHYFNNVIGNPLEAAIAVGHLIGDGVLDRYPDLKICVAHGGGYLPAYPGRMDHAHRARADCAHLLPRPPSEYLAQLYFDTVLFDPDQLRFLVEKYGADHILLGTDYPYDMAESDPIGFVDRAGFAPADRDKIVGANAAQLLGLRALTAPKPRTA